MTRRRHNTVALKKHHVFVNAQQQEVIHLVLTQVSLPGEPVALEIEYTDYLSTQSTKLFLNNIKLFDKFVDALQSYRNMMHKTTPPHTYTGKEVVMNNTAKEQMLSQEQVDGIIAAALKGWQPVNETPYVLKDTDMIIRQLADMWELQTNQVATAMVHLGYNMFFEQHGARRHGWMMRSKNKV